LQIRLRSSPIFYLGRGFVKSLCKSVLFSFLLFSSSFLFSQGNRPFVICAGNSSHALAAKVAKYLGVSLSEATLGHFNDGETSIQIKDSVRNKEVFVVQSTCSTKETTVNDSIVELLLLIRTLRRASAGQVTAVIPYYGYARQDRKTKPRAPISASDIAMFLEAAGADRVVAADLHCGQVQGFFRNIPVDNLHAVSAFVEHAQNLELESPVVVSPDAGGVARAKKFRDLLGEKGVKAGFAMVVKQRAEAGAIASVDLVGDVKGRDVLITDDIVDTAGTLVSVVKELKKFGAKKVYVYITHPVLSNNALDRIAKSEITEMVTTDTIPIEDELPENMTQISIAPLLAKAISLIHNGQPIATLFDAD
jgi:ribose-phosphate pyrophosphokinase